MQLKWKTVFTVFLKPTEKRCRYTKNDAKN